MDYRKTDANLNRACEGVRVLEDTVRFDLNREDLTRECRSLRHDLRTLFAPRMAQLIASRDSETDVGVPVSRAAADDGRCGLPSVIAANSKRIQEALRVLEESLKGNGFYEEAKKAEALRFRSYTLEKKVTAAVLRRLPEGLYGITAEKFANGKGNVRSVREMVDAGIRVIQYREKYRTMKEKAAEAKEIRKITADAGVVFIVNDHPDLALLCEADGVHIGQDDWDPADVRRIMGDTAIIGLSTHNPDQAQAAMRCDIDYIGCGPIFQTFTKDDVCAPVGLDYLNYVSQNVTLPYVAIGGIKLNNIDAVLKYPVRHIALVSEIVGADDVKAMVGALNEKIKQFGRNQ